MTAPTLTRDEWLSMRGIGSSDAAAACGESNVSPAEIVLRKIGKMPDPALTNMEAIKWGIRHEPWIVADIAEMCGLRLLDFVRDRPMIEREIQLTGLTEVVGWVEDRQPFLRSTHRPWQTATLDGIAVNGDGLVLIEAKNAGQYHSRAWDTENGLAPPKFEIQLVHQMAVAPSFHWGLLAGLVGGNSLRFISRLAVEIQSTIGAVIFLEAEVWRCVEEGSIPSFDGSESYIRALRALHPLDNGQSIDLPESSIAWHAELKGLLATHGPREKRIKEIKREIEAAMDGNTYGVLPLGAGTYSNHHQDRAEYVAKACSFPVLRFSKEVPRPKIDLTDYTHRLQK